MTQILQREHIGDDATAQKPLAFDCTRIEALPDEDVTDTDLARAFIRGLLIGAPATFVITGCLALLGGVSVGIAAMIGGWAATMGGGWFFGGIFFLRHYE